MLLSSSTVEISPFTLAIQPLVSTIAAGCSEVVKPHELSPVMERLVVGSVFEHRDQDAVRVMTSGPNDIARILGHWSNVISFAGSSKVGKIIFAAAAKSLTPTILELGGLNPVIVTASADVDLAAKKIAISK